VATASREAQQLGTKCILIVARSIGLSWKVRLRRLTRGSTGTPSGRETADPLEKLRPALADGYRIEGEPGRGGLSHDEPSYRLLANLVPGARLVPLQSRNHIPLADEPAWQEFLDAATGFWGEGS